MDGVIRDVTLSNAISGETVKAWVGRPWVETVADSGIDKVRRSVEDARARGFSAYRQIPQLFPSGLELPIEYTTVRLGHDSGMLAVGRNLTAVSELQSRLVAAQQAMERDYWKLREVETRYRLLFDASTEAVLILNVDDLRVEEANPAAIRALGLTRGWEFINEMAAQERDSFRTLLSRVREGGRAPGGVFHLGADQAPWILRISLMNGDPSNVYMVQLIPVESGAPMIAPRTEPIALASLMQRIPDGFIVIDCDGIVRRANQAFVDLVQAGAEGAVLGQRLDRWLSRPGADLSTLLTTLRRNGMVRLFSTVIEGELGTEIDVEVSAAGDAVSDPAFIGVVIRDIGRRIPLLSEAPRQPALPALTGPNSKTPLRDLVQTAVAVVERHYLESALEITSGNRTAAAELLGVSRQSLYAKMNRYNLENGSQRTEADSD